MAWPALIPCHPANNLPACRTRPDFHPRLPSPMLFASLGASPSLSHLRESFMHHKALLKQIFQDVFSILDMYPGVPGPSPVLSMVSAVLPV